MKYLRLKKQIRVLEGKNELLELSNYRLWERIKRLELQTNRRRAFNKELTQKIASLRTELKEKDKEPISFNISMNKEDIDDIIKKVTENVLCKQEEHECTAECFGKHVIKTLQKDYDSSNKKYRAFFIKYWYEKLQKEYHWLECLFVIDGKIFFKSKESSI